jgi:hypothetical protein
VRGAWCASVTLVILLGLARNGTLALRAITGDYGTITGARGTKAGLSLHDGVQEEISCQEGSGCLATEPRTYILPHIHCRWNTATDLVGLADLI